MATEEQPTVPVEEKQPTPEELETQRIAEELKASLAIAVNVYGKAEITALLEQAHQEQKVFFLKQVGLLFTITLLPPKLIEEYPREDVRAKLKEPYPTGSSVRVLLHRGESVLLGNFLMPTEVTSEVASS